jgi:hypothetical protein
MTVPTEAGAETSTAAPRPGVPSSLVSGPIHLQDLVAAVVDQLDGDPAAVGAREGA